MVRSITSLALMLAALPVCADRIVLAPTATKLPEGAVRADWLSCPGHGRDQCWVGYGLGDAFELEITGERFGSEGFVPSFNFAYNYITPITDMTPGISVGIQDALNRGEDGRSGYLALTFRFGNEGDLNQDVPTEVTLGAATHNGGTPFGGVKLPFAEQLWLVAEHDGIRLTSGVEVRPFKGASLRWMFRDRQTMVGAAFTHRF